MAYNLSHRPDAMYAKGDPVDMAETLKTFPVQLTSIRDYAQGVLATA